MSKIFLKLSIGLLAVSSAVWPAGAAGPVMKTLSGHVPLAVSRLVSTGSLPATNELTLAIALPLRNPDGLTNLLEQIYDPSSPNYGHYLTPDQFTSQFGPTEKDYQAIKDFATANGLTVSGTHPNRVLLDVTGKASDVEKAFHVKFKTYKHPTENRTFFAPDSEPTVDSSLPILHVSQMDNYYIPHPNIKKRPQTRPLVPHPALGSAPDGSYIGQDFRNAYVPGTPLTGAGQNVGLLQFDGFFPADPAAYATQIGLANPPKLIVVPIDGGVATPGPGNIEVCLDIEMTFSMAPGVGNIYVYEAPNPSPWVDLLSRMANDNLAKNLSCSWGGGPPDAGAEQIFQQMALQGQTFFNACGDSDAFTGAIPFPSDSPHITEAGGTTLTTTNGTTYASETVWNWGNEFGPIDDGIGSCGGISTFYSIPTWQTNINFTTSHGSSTQRNTPDVALTADNIWVVSDSGQATGGNGGTSAAAPLWCAYTALMNQQAALNSKPTVGFLNPSLYNIAKNSTVYTNAFHDVTTGNNTWSQSPNQFFATNVYDLCTGLGSPNGTNLINTLVGNSPPSGSGFAIIPAQISAPAGPWSTNLSILSGSNPNGDWFLFVQDDKVFDTGMINSGWYVTLTTANFVGASADNYLVASRTNLVFPTGTNFNFTLTVTNYGPSPATNVVVNDTLPTPGNGVTLISTNPSAGTTITRLGGAFTWNIGNLAVSNGAALTLSFATAANGSYVNLPVVSASNTTPDPNPDDNTAQTVILVGNPNPVLSGGVTTGPGNHTQFSVSDPYGNVSVIVQFRTNLLLGAWQNIYTNTTPFTFTDLNETNNPNGFYRAITGP